MKTLYVILLMMVLPLYQISAQECKVFSKAISESYSGDCKKGKADGTGKATGVDRYEGEFKKGYPNGSGTYTWQDGRVYIGLFKKGKKDGKGKLTFKPDSTIVGFWKNDQYIGEYENPFKKTDVSQNITLYTIKQVQNDINVVRIYLKEDNLLIKNPELNVVLQRGNYQMLVPGRDFYEIRNATFPLKARVLYKQEFFEFEIFNQGLWDIRIEITNINGIVSDQ